MFALAVPLPQTILHRIGFEIVNDFGIKYVAKVHAAHLLTELCEHYTVTTNWTGTKFAGIDITWDYMLLGQKVGQTKIGCSHAFSSTHSQSPAIPSILSQSPAVSQ